MCKSAQGFWMASRESGHSVSASGNGGYAVFGGGPDTPPPPVVAPRAVASSAPNPTVPDDEQFKQKKHARPARVRSRVKGRRPAGAKRRGPTTRSGVTRDHAMLDHAPEPAATRRFRGRAPLK